jgi:uncharacterized integral membrane protein
MRLLAALFLIAILAVIGIFAYQNDESVSLDFLKWRVVAPLSVVLGIAFAAGMLGGWSFYGVIRRSVIRATERRPH